MSHTTNQVDVDTPAAYAADMATTRRPGTAALDWAKNLIAEDARIISATGLREGGNPWLLHIEHTTGTTDAVLKLDQAGDSPGFVTELAALRLAEEHGIAAPRVLGFELHEPRAVLETLLPGTSTIPAEAGEERLSALGRAAAAIQTVEVQASPDLPARVRPISVSDFSRDRRTGKDHSTPLLAAADELVAGLPVPAAPARLVHGDLWQGNMLWTGDTVSGLIDWDMAGVGHPGIDLSSLRLDAALMFGSEAAAPVLAAWQDATGQTVDDLAYWDAVAALNQPGDMSGFAPVIQDQGRHDLTAAVLNDRRDSFLRDALERLG